MTQARRCTCRVARTSSSRRSVDPLVPSRWWPICSGVWAAATNDLWAVGSAGAVVRWDGSNWSRESAPETEGDWTAVTGTSSNDVLDRGQSDCPLQRRTMVRLRRKPCDVAQRLRGRNRRRVGGRRRRRDPAFRRQRMVAEREFPSELNLKTVWCGATDDVWAIDAVDGVLHWDGESWFDMRVNSGSLTEVRSGQILAGSAPDDVWVLSLVSDNGRGLASDEPLERGRGLDYRGDRVVVGNSRGGASDGAPRLLAGRIRHLERAGGITRQELHRNRSDHSRRLGSTRNDAVATTNRTITRLDRSAHGRSDHRARCSRSNASATQASSSTELRAPRQRAAVTPVVRER